jgi:tRNA(Ile)-lysidine synthase
VTRSHPPSLLTQVSRTLREECKVSPGAGVVVALSGGTDSMVLVHALSRLAVSHELRLLACGIDHGLRPAAAAELDRAQTYCEQLGVAFCRRNLQLAPGPNLQARARDARYAALEGVRAETGMDFVATAHHANDRAETVLLRLLRGAPPEGLAVLSARSGSLLRPLIRVTKVDVTSYQAQHAVPVSLDPSNLDPRFLRTRIRTELMPLLQELSPGILGHLTTLADELMAPALPPIAGIRGEPLTLNRGQRSDLRRALAQKNAKARVVLAGGNVLQFDEQSGQPVVVCAAHTQSAAKAPKGASGK